MKLAEIMLVITYFSICDHMKNKTLDGAFGYCCLDVSLDLSYFVSAFEINHKTSNPISEL